MPAPGSGRTRRELLRLLAGGLAVPALVRRAQAQEAPAPAPLPPLPKVNGGINIQPLRKLDPDPGDDVILPGVVDAQLRAVYELGFQQLRITIPYNRFGPDFFAAVPYVRAARALGLDVVGVMADFSGYDLPQALVQRPRREAVVRAYLGLFAAPVPPASPALAESGGFALQVLNEPTHTLGISPESYVREFLSPTYGTVKALSRSQLVAAAAEVGDGVGVLRVRAMVEVGLERVCDCVAYHVYERGVAPHLSGLALKPVWVTESGAEGPANHRPWVEQVFPELQRRIATLERVFYYVLYEARSGGFRLIDIRPGPAGAFDVVVESPELVSLYGQRVAAATGGAPHAAYSDLVPDVTLYFPTEADRAFVASLGLD